MRPRRTVQQCTIRACTIRACTVQQCTIRACTIRQCCIIQDCINECGGGGGAFGGGFMGGVASAPSAGRRQPALTRRQGVLNVDVVFPVIPFADAGRPSMGVSLLAAEAQAAGYSAKVMYFNLRLAGDMAFNPISASRRRFRPFSSW